MNRFFRKFEQSIEGIDLPVKFTFPFYYTPHPLVEIAVAQLQSELMHRDFNHNFGLDPEKKGLIIGKMFGVLIVRNEENKLGFLAAFSGKLGDKNHHTGFVPPVYDMLESEGYFKEGEKIINKLTAEIEEMESSSALKQAEQYYEKTVHESVQDLNRLKSEIKVNKKSRKERRIQVEKTFSEEELKEFNLALSQESIKEQYTLKDAKRYWEYKITEAQESWDYYLKKIETLKDERRQRSSQLQQRLFSDYTFLNAHHELKSLLDIFHEKDQSSPIAGSGECSAPKLLHFAYKNHLTPIAMGEFWWGASPKSEVRNHQHFYPACRGKCEPILGHMLQGLDVEENPMMKAPKEINDLSFIYEDDYLVVVNKPAEFLSVPGKNVYDSVYTRLEARFPEATGPLLVHRLDMSTSGLLLAAKTKDVHKQLQSQFLKRTITKRYEALLDGVLEENMGEISLPLRVDLENRPQQLVCYEYGKPALTRWEKVWVKNGKTLVHFYPITGRTHQLRVHAAHSSGLNIPIVGDDLYGTSSNRLHLHAAYLKFEHPISKEIIELYVPSSFSE